MIDEDFYVYFHDCYLGVTGVSISKEVMDKWYNTIPQDIKNYANEWGWNDTLIREHLMIFIENILEE